MRPVLIKSNADGSKEPEWQWLRARQAATKKKGQRQRAGLEVTESATSRGKQ